MPILQMMKLQFSEVKQLAQDHRTKVSESSLNALNHWAILSLESFH